MAKKEKIRVLQWASQSSYLNLTNVVVEHQQAFADTKIHSQQYERTIKPEATTSGCWCYYDFCKLLNHAVHSDFPFTV